MSGDSKKRKSPPLNLGSDHGMEQQSFGGPPEIGSHEIIKSVLIGEGTFGKVYRGRCREKDVAIKVLHKQQMDAKTLANFRKEVAIASKIFHPNIVLFMGACTEEGNMMIVTELLPKGDLQKLLSDQSVTLSLYTRMKMANDAALAMTWLHGSNPIIIHRDLKTQNLLLDEHYRIKVCDFGLSEFRDRQHKTLKDGKDGAKGTPLWMAPEVLLGREFNEKADVYSFGIVLWEILTRQEPFTEFTQFTQFRQAVCISNVRPHVPDDTDLVLKRLIEACWQKEPSPRPSFPEIVDKFRTILVESAIQDPTGREFWKTYFCQRDTGNPSMENFREVVSWDDFWTAFLQFVEKCNRNAQQQQQQQRLQQQQQAQVPLPPQPTWQNLMDASEWQLQEYASRGASQYQHAAQEFRRRQPPSQSMELDPTESDLNMRCLRALLAEQPKAQGITTSTSEEGIVSVEKFGKILQLFGPIRDSTGRVTLLNKVTSLLRKPWFHGDLSTQDAVARLTPQRVGTFLVRFSSSQPGCYTISKVAEPNTINHQRVIFSQGNGYIINNKSYSSLEHLIDAATNELQVLESCPGSPYAQIFAHSKGSYYVPFRTSGYVQSSSGQFFLQRN